MSKIEVASLEGLFDEKAEALLMNIRDRRLCVKHNWVNASLCWEKDNRSISLENTSPQFPPAWGGGYGGIRYCRKCKEIDCIHYWDEEYVYVIKHNSYVADTYSVAHCKFCQRRILRSSSRSYSPNSKAFDIIDQAAIALGRPSISSQFPAGHYGSGFYCELPAAVSLIIDRDGVEAARAYALQVFGPEGCQGAMDMVR